MIKSAELKFFRRHEDLTVDFTTGLNVLRGPNESGKTTLLEGICYAVFGAAALRDTLAETVTWGHKESELKTKTVLCFSGIDYVFTRSKGGAECNYDGKKVTGQKEVSAFAAQLLGADAKMAAALIMASQSDLRGALDEGPTAVSTLMSKLADFDLIDRLVKAAESTLSLGAEQPVRDRIERTQAALAVVEANVPSEAQIDYYQSLIDSTFRLDKEARLELETKLDPLVIAAREVYALEVRSQQQMQRLMNELTGLIFRRDTTKQQIEVAKAKLQARPDLTLLVTAKSKLTDALNHDSLVKAYNLVKGLPAYPAVFWEGNMADFHKELEGMQAKERDLIQQAQLANQQASRIRKSKITNGKCPTCGHAAVSDDHVAEHNKKIEAEAAEFDTQFNDFITQKNAMSGDLAAMQSLLRSADPFLRVKTALEPLDVPKKIDLDVFPPRITWTGEVPQVQNIPALQKAVADLEQQERAATLAEGQLQAHQESYDGIIQEIIKNQEARDLVPAFNVALAEEQMAKAMVDQVAKLNEISRLDSEAAGYIAEKDRIIREIESAKTNIENAKAHVEQAQKDLAELISNNVLMAKLKKLKPMITDHLWQTVLAAVSNFFTAMRGEQSLVTKEPSGFKVNNKSVDSLSGSTIDVLAIALRVGLTKTFIPHVPFISLDEPAHGCDAMRTGNVLGFLSAAGFQQVLLASHDELSESVADRVVALGA